jgi:hypothetical protein
MIQGNVCYRQASPEAVPASLMPGMGAAVAVPSSS